MVEELTLRVLAYLMLCAAITFTGGANLAILAFLGAAYTGFDLNAFSTIALISLVAGLAQAVTKGSEKNGS